MFITKKHMPRRTFLQGTGVTLALPLIEAMIPATTALAQTPASPKPRFIGVFYPHGMAPGYWEPEAEGPLPEKLPYIADVLEKVKEKFGVPILTDVHEIEHCRPAAEVCDVLQIPAFLCRQTDLIQAAARTKRCINVKKGQFLAPTEAQHAIAKMEATGNRNLMLTERGSSFGYNNLVVDMRSLAIMRELGYPVVFDATHSVQMPGAGGYTGGDRRMAPVLARAAVAAGCDGIFLEAHPNPARAKRDHAASCQSHP